MPLLRVQPNRIIVAGRMHCEVSSLVLTERSNALLHAVSSEHSEGSVAALLYDPIRKEVSSVKIDGHLEVRKLGVNCNQVSRWYCIAFR